MTRIALLAAAVVVAGLSQIGVAAGERTRGRSCASYPTPGSLAPLRTRTPADLGAEYGVLRRAQRPQDRLPVSELSDSLTASGVITSGIRLLGHASFGGRVYAVPAEHLLGFKLAPLRCLPRADRSLERELQPSLRHEYAHHALCIVIVLGTQGSASCSSAPGTAEPLLEATGSPGLGLVPDGVPKVSVQYFHAGGRRATVHDNFWIVNRPGVTEYPCGLEWLTNSGTVLRIVRSCTGD